MSRTSHAVLTTAVVLALGSCTHAGHGAEPPGPSTGAALPAPERTVVLPPLSLPSHAAPADRWVMSVVRKSGSPQCPLSDAGSMELLDSDGHSNADLLIVVGSRLCVVSIFRKSDGTPQAPTFMADLPHLLSQPTIMATVPISADPGDDELLFFTAFPGDVGPVQVRNAGFTTFQVRQATVDAEGKAVGTLVTVRSNGYFGAGGPLPELCPATGPCRPLFPVQ